MKLGLGWKIKSAAGRFNEQNKKRNFKNLDYHLNISPFSQQNKYCVLPQRDYLTIKQTTEIQIVSQKN